ncbi:MAG: T9SS type A sorting domain-containing protein [Chlorobi bacterium]|nr:T9SS type A sorting domain-containing protein [Chlorobiota bacterium]
MNPIKKAILLLIITQVSLKIPAQIPVGTWRDHFSYKKALYVADAEDKIYIAGEIAVWSFDKNEKTIEKLTKIQGYSDAEIQTTAWNSNQKALLIAYKNSNIDILKNNTIYNFSEIKRKQISTDKTIYNITFAGNTAYLACGFGIVLLDMENLEFKDTWFIGNNASYVKVNDIAFDETYIYAATDEGLLFADFTNSNLADYRNWNLVPDIPDNDSKYNMVETFDKYIITNQINPATGNDTLYIKKDGAWELFGNDIEELCSIRSSEKNIILTMRHEIKIFDTSLNLTRTFDTYNFSGYRPDLYMNDALLDKNGNLIIADYSFGLVYENDNKQTNYVYPNGPFNNYTAKAVSFDNKVITTDGNIKATGWYTPVYNIFENNEWKTYRISPDTARNFFSVAVNPKNKNNLFFGTWGYGIFEFNDNTWTNAYNNLNSTLEAIPGYDYGYIRIYGVTFDLNNNLWVTNQGVGEPVSVKTEDGQWKSYNFGGSITNDYVEDIYTTTGNIKWVELGLGKGMLVFDDNNTPLNPDDDRHKIIYPQTSEGEQISTEITALTEDLNNNIWMGTGNGIVVYYNPDEVFDDNFFAERIQLTSYGKDTTEQYLLSTDIINDIETDGANRKWIATANSGVFLVSDNGKEEIYHFDKYNSPLISDNINDITVNGKTGEVFFLTDIGIMSFRAEATDADNIFKNVYVFPNPVRPGYKGKITVTGLARDVNVKITDISGNIVYETTALGGQAIWDGKTFDGRKVNTGVYLVFCSNSDGTQTYVTKLLFVN